MEAPFFRGRGRWRLARVACVAYGQAFPTRSGQGLRLRPLPSTPELLGQGRSWPPTRLPGFFCPDCQDSPLPGSPPTCLDPSPLPPHQPLSRLAFKWCPAERQAPAPPILPQGPHRTRPIPTAPCSGSSNIMVQNSLCGAPAPYTSCPPDSAPSNSTHQNWTRQPSALPVAPICSSHEFAYGRPASVHPTTETGLDLVRREPPPLGPVVWGVLTPPPTHTHTL